MAAKIKEGLRDIKQGVLEKLTGPKYADNLLGESLQDQLRKATAKELVGPNEELNSQVVDTINQDIANGKDSKEIVSLLKKRLRTDNPHKQWLAVQLVGRVLRDCSAGIGLHTEDVLQEVARAMARPAKADSDAGRITRQAAKELLRSFGRAGAGAVRAANRSVVEDARTHSRNAMNLHASAGGAPVNAEAASLVAEVQMLVEQANANTELLSEMLITGDQAAGASGPAAAAGGAKDEFENELTRELVTEVRELRGLFDAYLEQLQALMSSGQGGPDVEAALMRALEAGDMLDGALALAQDVSTNQRELEQQAVAGGGASGGGANPAAAAAAAVDLISLDDFAMPAPPPVLATGGAGAPQDPFAALAAGAAAAAPHDPFAASNITPAMAVGSPPAAAAPAAAYQPYPAAAPAAYPPYGQPAAPAPYGAQPPAPYGQPPPAAAAQPYPGAPPPYGQPAAAPANPNNPFAGAVPTYGSVAAPPAGSAGVSAAPSNNPFSAAPSVTSGGGAAPPAAAAGLTGGSGTSSVDAEWAMFFAGRTGASGAPPQQQQPAGGAH
ncbi:hypothetical protein CHLRE_13g585100v5 [Chlamydomonas reinhardtii]|uniref:VHS domain-containing protein n=1 Tax=Chlamydomonas reinhardtii TaxID=3055 RepID=A0A2K3D0P9_CHLRE|nr:uncharacterized protein CHLRE_13g585100v5 [Chlamydomonas reinhardtii]PNW74097.1 hypothetical protein CHLRE_13g585100v5 [Chlamydomonas reinhardtii]